jgi:tetratricopeptide (TPR) repeat protein
MLAGDPETAEMHLRLEYESLSQMGDKGILATTAALLARAIAAQGEKRFTEATELIAISQEVAADEDTSAQVICLGLSARILADRGRHAEAVDLAFSAVALAEQTDQLSPHADALLELAQALAASGRTFEAHDAAAQALELYQRKGNLPGIREALGCFTQHALI